MVVKFRNYWLLPTIQHHLPYNGHLHTHLYPLEFCKPDLTDSRQVNHTHHLTINCMAIPIRQYSAQSYEILQLLQVWVMISESYLNFCTISLIPCLCTTINLMVYLLRLQENIIIFLNLGLDLEQNVFAKTHMQSRPQEAPAKVCPEKWLFLALKYHLACQCFSVPHNWSLFLSCVMWYN